MRRRNTLNRPFCYLPLIALLPLLVLLAVPTVAAHVAYATILGAWEGLREGVGT